MSTNFKIAHLILTRQFTISSENTYNSYLQISLTVRSSDGSLEDEEEITLTVNEVNIVPQIAAIGNKIVNEMTTLVFTASALDSDLPSGNLTFSLLGAPTGAEIDAVTGEFS